MYIKELSKEANKAMRTELPQIARKRPFCPICEVDSVYNGDSYTVFLLLEQHHLYVLYAVRAQQMEKDIHYELITQRPVLCALSELIVYQAEARCSQ